MESARSYQSSKTTSRRFSITEYQGTLEDGSNALNTAVKDNSTGAGEESANADAQNENNASETTSQLQNDWQNRFGIASSRINMRSSANNTATDIRQLSLRYIFNMLFGNRTGRYKDFYEDTGISAISSGTTAYSNYVSYGNYSSWQSSNVSSAQSLEGAITKITTSLKVLNYTQESYEWEQESTSFSTVGTVKTSDGRELNFNINVGMSREFEQYYSENLDIASFTMCDPLVINMDTDAAELSDQTFYFDIDADGELDEISGLGAGSGYLALDKNGDGIINDGSELFGTASGNGFKDLAEYDDDGNGWIDENDAIWSKLQIWTKDEDGNDRLYRLADKGIGAICLQNVATDFTLKDDEGQTKGAIRNTGIFLYENGMAGTVQHVDVAKYAMEA
jgi:hypothetical protein